MKRQATGVRFTAGICEKEMRRVTFGTPTAHPEHRVVIKSSDIKALKKYLRLKEKLERRVFPKMEVTFP